MKLCYDKCFVVSFCFIVIFGLWEESYSCKLVKVIDINLVVEFCIN